DGFSTWNDTELIRKIDEDFAKKYEASAERASATKVTSTIQTASHKVGDTVGFWYAISKNNSSSDYSYKRDDAVCKYVGTYCDVFFMDNNSIIDKSRLDFRALGKKFDEIYVKETDINGTNKYSSHSSEYIDPQSKITILVTDLFQDATTTQTGGTYGYFSSTDMRKNGYTNQKQMIYIDSYFYSFDGSSSAKINGTVYDLRNQVYSTLVHEFNHLLNFCTKTVTYEQTSETWFTEMLSMLTEDLFSNYLGIDAKDSPVGRLSYYFDYNTNKGFSAWLSGDDVYCSYANCFAYGAYLVRNYGGIKLFKELAGNNKVNGDSVTAALYKLGYNKTFEDTVKEFPLVLINYNKTSGITLNKSSDDYRTDKLGFDAIKMYPYTVNTSTGDVKVDSPPVYKSSKGEGATLYPTGFTIHTIGKGISSFNYCKPTKDADSIIDGYISNISGGEIYDTIY
ncbi:MAG: hypothetical protein K6A43_05995, partial [Treponema sp.]|nr:hypothetical protein [Treponema sp.]